jgi:hypothetical protein
MGDKLLIQGFKNLISPDAHGDMDLSKLERELYGAADTSKSSIDKVAAQLAGTASSLGLELGGDFDESFAGTPIATPGNTPRQQTPRQPTPRATPRSTQQYTPVQTVPMPSYEEMTNEEVNRQRISSVMEEMQSPVISFAAEKARDEKLQLLAEIDDLKDQLRASNAKTDNIREVDENSSLDEVVAVRNILRFKDDRIKYSAIANEIIMFGAYAIEEVFNGEREFFGYRWDMRGWSSHVQVKLRRIRSELSTITSGIFEETGMSPFTRVALELLPSAVIYSRTKASQLNQPLLNISEDADFDGMNARLKNIGT